MTRPLLLPTLERYRTLYRLVQRLSIAPRDAPAAERAEPRQAR